MPFYDRACPACQNKLIDCWEQITAPVVVCACGTDTKRVIYPTTRAVIQDSIEGGVLIYNGLCNPDGSPKRYYSKSEIARAAAAKGLTPMDNVHIPNPASGSDKAGNGLTTRWCLPMPITEAERLKHWHETEMRDHPKR